MARYGYKLMTEEHGPKALVANAVAAEAAGFDFVSISDHFHPWLEAQGHAPFAWSVLGAIAHAFLPGHRIRIDISSSAYPMFNPNQNTGNPIATDTEWKVAHQHIVHDAQHPSALVLPVL